MKTCPKCKETKSIDDFFNDKSRCDGKTAACKACEYARKKLRRQTLAATKAQSPAYREGKRRQRKNFKAKNPHLNLIKGARQRAKDKGLPYDLNKYYKELRERFEQGVCEVSGLPIKKTPGQVTWDTPSIDRIEPEKGYVYSNVRIVAYAVNVALNDWGLEQFIEIARAVDSRYKLQQDWEHGT
jgi:hypothetical protein